MFRKSTMITLALVAVLSSFACNSSVVGPAPTSTQEENGPGRPGSPVEHDKVCIDDLRAVEIVTPYESQILRAGDRLTVSWDAIQFCNGYYAEVRVSFDSGASWTLVGAGKDTQTMSYRVPNISSTARFQVTLRQEDGFTVSDEVQLASPILSDPAGGDRDGPVEHD